MPIVSRASEQNSKVAAESLGHWGHSEGWIEQIHPMVVMGAFWTGEVSQTSKHSVRIFQVNGSLDSHHLFCAHFSIHPSPLSECLEKGSAGPPLGLSMADKIAGHNLSLLHVRIFPP